MDASSSIFSFNVLFGVVLVDILLGGDNAIIIALASKKLSAEHRRKAMIFGIAGALLARLLLTGMATLAMQLPLIKLVGGLLLLKISIDLIVDNQQQNQDDHSAHSGESDLYTAAKTIIIADVIMSLDNVVALSAVTQNNFPMLVFGLLLSVPILMYGSVYIGKLLEEYPILIWLGAGILGSVSGSLIIDDPVFSGAIVNTSSVADSVVPVLTGIYTIIQSRIILERSAIMQGSLPPKSLWEILFPKSTLPLSEENEKEEEQAAVVVKTDNPIQTVNQAPAPEETSSENDEEDAVHDEGFFASGYRVAALIATVIVVVIATFLSLVDTDFNPLPKAAISYTCSEPALIIHYKTNSGSIQLVTKTGNMTAPLSNQQIGWKDYRIASTALGIPPPQKIISVDSEKMVVSGGAFENATCQRSLK